jgi:hypothetical protein
MYIQPIRRRVWNEHKSEVEELPDIYGYAVIASDGKTVLAESESREEAMREACKRILLPLRRKKLV